MRKMFGRTLGAALAVVVGATMLCGGALAIPQDVYDAAVAQRDALYQQLVDAGIEPCVSLAQLPDLSGLQALKEGDGWRVNKEYYREPMFSSDYHYYGALIENTSDSSRLYEARVIFYDADDTPVGVSEESWKMGAGYERFFMFTTQSEYDHFSLDITSTEVSFQDVRPALDLKLHDNGNGVVLITGTNITDKTVGDDSSIEAVILLLDEWGSIVDYHDTYLLSSIFDDPLAPGDFVMKEVDTYCRDYDHVEVIIEGRL